MKPTDEIINNSIVVKDYPPYYNKLDIIVDPIKARESFNNLLLTVGLEYDSFIKSERDSCMEVQKDQPFEDRGMFWELPFSHVKGLTGLDRLLKYRGSVEMLRDMGIHDRDLTETLEELKTTYLYTIIEQVYNKHKELTNRDFKGKIHCLWIDGQERYHFHTDHKHNPIRYHIPIVTSDKVFWILQENDNNYKLQMPLGTVYQFYPLEIMHSVVNLGTEPRLHLVISECLE